MRQKAWVNVVDIENRTDVSTVDEAILAWEQTQLELP